ncbi:hypothetical protein CsSME_00030072 [Camellia sinensis var. sinensis]
MAVLQFLLSNLPNSHFFLLYSSTHFTISTTFSIPIPRPPKLHNPKPPRASINGEPTTSPQTPKPSRQGRKKNPTTSQTQSSSKPKRTRKTQSQNNTIEANGTIESTNDVEDEDYDDGIDFPYEDPPLICCFGAAQKEFVPTVRISEEQMHQDRYSEFVQNLGFVGLAAVFFRPKHWTDSTGGAASVGEIGGPAK